VKSFCSHCGEELLGAVNACWRCGRRASANNPLQAEVLPESENEIEATSEETAEDEVHATAEQEETEDLTQSNEAETSVLAEDPSDAESKPDESIEPNNEAELVASHVDPIADTNIDPEIDPALGTKPIRAGSPFIEPEIGHDPRLRQKQSLVAEYPKHVAAAGGGVGSICMAAVTVVGSFLVPYFFIGRLVPFAAVLTSGIGIALALWGLFSNQRKLAWIGLLLCMLLFIAASVLCTFDFYFSVFDRYPWDPKPEVEF